MRLSAFALSLLLEELSPLLVGGFIQTIHQPLADAVTLDIRQPGQSVTLLASAHSQAGRLHVISRPMVNPSTPPAFCQYLRANVQGARIQAIDQTPDDRIIWLTVTKPPFSGYLVIALTGRRANLYLLDAHKHVLRRLRPDHLAVGQLYQVPTFSSERASANNQRETSATRSWANLARDKHPTSRFPLSLALEEHFQQLSEKQRAERQAHLLRSSLRKAIIKTQRRIRAINHDLEQVTPYENYQRYGELLKGYLGRLSSRQSHITVVDYFDERLPEFTLPLDPEKTGPENLNDYFKKYARFTGAQKNLVPRLEHAQTELVKLQKEFHALESGQRLPPSEQRAKPPNSPQGPQRSKPKRQQATPYRRVCSQDGHAILVGKTAKDNDAVTFKVSKPDDLWLHARGTAGSHVIIELDKKQHVPPDALKDAATLALFYSDLRKSGKGEVMYTLRKHVRKPKGAKPGSVTVTQEKTLWVTIDQARLDRLKESNG